MTAMDGGNTGNAGRLQGSRRYDSRDGIGRVESGQRPGKRQEQVFE